MFRSKKGFELSPRLKLGIGRGHSQNQIMKIGAALCLIFAVVLSLNAIRLLFSHATTTAGAAAPQVLGASDVRSAGDSNTVQFLDYKVQKGDTLFNVSQKFQIDWSTLATLNSLKSPFTLKSGQTLKVPKQ